MIDTETVEIVTLVAAKITEHLEKNFQVIPTLTLAQAAEAVGISDEKMRKLCKDGEIPYIRMDRLYRIKTSDINAYLDRHCHQSTKDTDRGE